MPFQLKHPTVIETRLTELDPADPPIVKFRQSTARENQLREALVFGPQKKAFTESGMEVRDSVAWALRQEIECRLTMCGLSGFLDVDENELFKFNGERLAMSDAQFHTAWGKIWPISICDRLHSLCLDANPDWDYRPKAAGEENPQKAEETETG